MNFVNILIYFLPLFLHADSSVKSVLESQDRPLVYINNSVIGVLETNDGPELAGSKNPDEVPSLVIDNSLINTLKAPVLTKVSHPKTTNPDSDMLPPPPMFDEPPESLGPLPQPIISVEPKLQPPPPPPPPPEQQSYNSIADQLLGAAIFQEPQGIIPHPESLITTPEEPEEETESPLTTEVPTTTTSDLMEQVFAEVVNEESTLNEDGDNNYDNIEEHHTSVSTKKPISTAAFTNIMNQLKAIMNMNGLSSFVISEPGIGSQLDRQLDKVRELEKRGKTTTHKSEASLFAQKRGNVTSRFQTANFNPLPVKKSVESYASRIHRRASNPFGSQPSAISKRSVEPSSFEALLKRGLQNADLKNENKKSLDKRGTISAVPSALKLDEKDDSNILMTSGLKNVLRNFGTRNLSARLPTTKVGDIDKEEKRSKNGTDQMGLGQYLLRKSGSIHGSVSKFDLENDKRGSPSSSEDAAKLAKMYYARHLNNKDEESKEQEK